jgi:hypothetical protein
MYQHLGIKKIIIKYAQDFASIFFLRVRKKLNPRWSNLSVG